MTKYTSRYIRTLAIVALASAASPAMLAAELTAADQTAIAQLYARYNTAIDHGDGEAWANTFTPDGVFANNFKGHDALVGFVKMWRTNPAMNGPMHRHFSADLVVTPSAEGATATVSTLIMDLSTKPISVANFMTYSDTLVKTADGWRFRNRALKAEGPPPAPPAGAGNAATAPAKPAGQ